MRTHWPRIAVVTPFLDKRHGTERCVAEQVERLARDYGYEVHLYTQRVEDVAVVPAEGPGRDMASRIVWHRVPSAPAGPYLVRYLWWFVANHWLRRRDARHGWRWDLVYSPGINCLDADVISVHIVFREFRQRMARELGLRLGRPGTWPRVMHRRAYYRLIMALERVVYSRGRAVLLAISQKTAGDLGKHYGRASKAGVSYHGIDGRFHPGVRARLRRRARGELGLPDEAYALLLIGNDWRKKGLPTVLEAVALTGESRVRVMVVGRDDVTLVEEVLAGTGLRGRVAFLPIRGDVEFYYAAADCYVGPSLEDAFALPPAEAMACGLPVIVSSQAGVSEIVTDGADALVLKDPRSASELAGLIKRILEEPGLARRLGDRAAVTARAYTWDRNAAELDAVIREVAAGKGRG
jgi:UDP-glucose:(heptosyl)LPS alpha-1,3-glucosyltransferase